MSMIGEALQLQENIKNKMLKKRLEEIKKEIEEQKDDELARRLELKRKAIIRRHNLIDL